VARRSTRVRFTKRAQADLQSLFTHISRDNPDAARALATRIRKACRGLRANPRIGPVVREFGMDTIRERVVPPYRIVYQIRDDEIRILAVVHGRALVRPPVLPDEG
jgi:addiction module RelE/StbE family toxin